MNLLWIVKAVALLLLSYILLLVLCSVLVNPHKEYEKNSRFYRFLLNSATAVTLKIVRIRVQVTGMERLPEQGRFLLVCNHRSKFDPIITWYIFRRYDLAFISKEENFRVPVFGRLIRKCCFMSIDRENPKNAMLTIQKAARLIQGDRVSVAVYPEGTRSKTQELLPFHNGVLKIAQKSHVPVVVMAIQGTEAIHVNYPCHSSRVSLDILDVLSADYVADCKTSELGTVIRQTMWEHISESQPKEENK